MNQTAEEMTIIRLSGQLDIHHRPRVRSLVSEAVESSRGHVLLDLREVRDVDSSGLSMLIATGRQLSLQGRLMLLVADSPVFLHLVQRTGVEGALRIFPSADAALEYAREPSSDAGRRDQAGTG